ncbi:MAG: antitoxin, RHH family protein [Candidatus Brocadiia bacterium]
MSAKNPRINVVLDRPIYQAIRKLAHDDGVSLSYKVRDLVSMSLEYFEDVVLTGVAEERERTFNRKKALTHRQVFPK